MKIVVVGIGYVGLSNAVLFSLKHDVTILDISKEKVDLVNQRKCPFKDDKIDEFFQTKNLKLKAKIVDLGDFKDADFVFIATPTNYDDELNYFDVSSVESTIKKIIDENKDANIVIKSTVPVGFTKEIQEKYGVLNLFFSPEFLREGHALEDNLEPSRIIVGVPSKEEKTLSVAYDIINLLKESATKENIPSFVMGATEAEATKLFANTFLAMRVAYFNELDTYAEVKGLNTKDIIDGVAKDPRIGDFYNNPSFGYGGYCLPKDSKQLKANFKDVPNQIISATVQANETRINFISDRIKERANKIKNPIIGIYRLTMKSGSDNFRSSSILAIINKLKTEGFEIIIYEPNISYKDFNGCKIINDLSVFKTTSSLIVANRYNSDLDDVKDKVYTRDLYKRD